MDSAYEVSTDQENIIIRLPRESIDPVVLQKLLDYLDLESLRRRSELTAEQAEGLASEVKRQAWHRVKHLFEEE